jgi:hypothetical protein
LFASASVIFCEAVAIYGVIVAIILQTKVERVDPVDGVYNKYALFSGFAGKAKYSCAVRCTSCLPYSCAVRCASCLPESFLAVQCWAQASLAGLQTLYAGKPND